MVWRQPSGRLVRLSEPRCSAHQRGIQGVFLIGAAFAAVGGLISWFLIPDREKDLESEDARFRAYLKENGFQGVFGDSLEDEIKTTSYKI